MAARRRWRLAARLTLLATVGGAVAGVASAPAEAASVVRPTVTAISLLDASPRADGAARWLVAFSEPVTGVRPTNFAIRSSGFAVPLPAVASVTPSADYSATYVVTTVVSAAALAGASATVVATLRLDLVSVGSGSTAIRSVPGGLLSGRFSSGETYRFLPPAPVVSIATVNGAAITASGAAALAGNVVIAGMCTPGATTVEIAAEAVSGSARCTSTGAWTATLRLGAGTYVFAAKQSRGGTAATSPSVTINVGAESVPPVIAVTTVNGSTQIEGSPIAFPVTTKETVASVGGQCGSLPGHATTVSVRVTGPTRQTVSVPCTAGAWTYALSPPIANDGSADGNYAVTATQVWVQASTAGATRRSASSGARRITVATKPLGISGVVASELSPGATSDLSLTLTNPHPFNVRLESIGIAFEGTAACDASNFAVERAFAGPVVVRPGTTVLTRTVSPRVTMIDKPVSQDACRDASITLRFNALGSRA